MTREPAILGADRPSPEEGMGAIPHDGGVTFRVWAPHADSMSVVGSFNDWSPDAHPLSPEEDGYWATDVEEAKPGDTYKYEIINGDQTLERIDPYARQVTHSDGCSVIYDPTFDWGEGDPFEMVPWNELVIYEMHVGTFYDKSEDGPGDFSSAIEKLSYLKDLGVTAIEVMPPMEFAGDFSWGYNPAEPFAIETAYGGPDAFKAFVKAAHEQDIAILLDVIYNHLGPGDLSLWRFDGWYEDGWGGIYFYNDERARTPWGDTRPNYGRDPVRRYLRDNALMWLTEYRVDGLRWDMTLYIRTIDGNISDPDDQLPEGWSLMQWINDEIDERMPGNITIAEDLRGDGRVVEEVTKEGAGFNSQWDADFAHLLRDPIVVQEDDDRDMEAVRQAIGERFGGDMLRRVIYVESHDEVANGKARVAQEIWPENSCHWFVKKRSTLGAVVVMTAPGIPMIFQGQEFLEAEWFRDQNSLNWEQAEELEGIVQLYGDLIALRRNEGGTTRGLMGQGVNIYHVSDDDKVVAFHRWEEGDPGDDVIVVLNFRNEPLKDYVVGLPKEGLWRLRFDSHGASYDDEFEEQISGDVETTEGENDGLSHGGLVSVAPYSAIILSQDE
ncbi:MAG: alpha-amylase family glycosyl hydrolase [Chloroflexota bacterium]